MSIVDEGEIMQLSRKEALSAFHYCGWESADTWPDDRLLQKLSKIPDVAPEESPDDPDLKALLLGIRQTVDSGGTFELSASSVRTVSPKVVETDEPALVVPEAVPVVPEAVPVETEAVPVVPEAVPVETEAVPVETEKVVGETIEKKKEEFVPVSGPDAIVCTVRTNRCRMSCAAEVLHELEFGEGGSFDMIMKKQHLDLSHEKYGNVNDAMAKFIMSLAMQAIYAWENLKAGK